MPRVLIVDDNEQNLYLLSKLLRHHGHEVTVANNGLEALEVARDIRPEIVITDILMPTMDGFALCREWKGDERFKEVPLVFYTATYTGPEDEAFALSLGAERFIIKPTEPDTFLRIMEEVLAEHGRGELVAPCEPVTNENVYLREYNETLIRKLEKRNQTLEQSNRELEKEVAARQRAQREQEQLIDQLKAQNAELDRFAHTVSHDLKSPLITIQGYVGLLAEGLAEAGIESMKEDLLHISRAADRMGVLLKDLLALSRIGRLVNPPEDTPLAELADDALDLVRGQIEAKGVEVQVLPDLPVVYGDRLRLLEVLQNLIDNALKYSRDGSRPQIEIGARQDGHDIICHVRDNGIGIEPRYHEKIFGLFDQLNPRMEGSGIGLALSRRIIEVHGGRIWVESEGEGHGSTFYFTLPLRREGAEALRVAHEVP